MLLTRFSQFPSRCSLNSHSAYHGGVTMDSISGESTLSPAPDNIEDLYSNTLKPDSVLSVTIQRFELNGGILAAGMLALGLFCTALPAVGSELPEPTQGSLYYETPQGEWQLGLPVNTQVQMQVSGLINRVHVQQTFQNTGETWLQGRYLFPLPDMSAVDGMELRIGERVIQGQIREKQRAKTEFEQARSAGKRASLVEQHRPNIFSTQVANLGPGETLTVSISYVQTLEYQSGQFSLRFPMLVAPRYQPDVDGGEYQTGKDEALAASYLMPMPNINNPLRAIDAFYQPDDSGVTGPVISPQQGASPGTVDIDVSFANAGLLGEIASPHHWVTVTPGDNDSVQVELLDAVPNRDFLLQWRMADDSRPGAMSYMQRGMSYPTEDPQVAATEQGQEYGLLLLVPPAMDKWHYEGNRELVLVIDTSGSMGGESIKQAKAALIRALETLTPKDNFNIVAFSSQLNLFASGSIPASADNLALARDFVRRLQADGGTNMAPALLQAMSDGSATPRSASSAYGYSGSEQDEYAQAKPSLLGQIIFITDGAVGNEQELFALISHNLKDKRLFTVGIGAAPNSFFMERAARSGKGTFTYIASEREVEQKMTELLEKIASPVLTNLKLRYEDGTVPEYWPATLPDLYAGEPVMVSLRQSAGRHDALLVSAEQGTLGDNQGNSKKQFWQERLSLKVTQSADGLGVGTNRPGLSTKGEVADDSAQQAGLDLLWAREQIAELNLSKTPATAQRIKEQVTALALKYHLVSPYTSLVAVDVTPARPVDAETRLAEAGLMMPAGWQPGTPGVMPQTATGSIGELMMGALLALLGLVGYWVAGRSEAGSNSRVNP